MSPVGGWVESAVGVGWWRVRQECGGGESGRRVRWEWVLRLSWEMVAENERRWLVPYNTFSVLSPRPRRVQLKVQRS